jgi:hypothetical protein
MYPVVLSLWGGPRPSRRPRRALRQPRRRRQPLEPRRRLLRRPPLRERRQRLRHIFSAVSPFETNPFAAAGPSPFLSASPWRRSAAFLPASCAAISRQHRHSRPLLFQARALSPPPFSIWPPGAPSHPFQGSRGQRSPYLRGSNPNPNRTTQKKKTPSAGLSRQGRV